MADQKFKQLEEQLKRIGCNYQFWGRAELKELAQIILPGEIVEHCVNGMYEGGFAMLTATNQRILLVDKKPFYLTLEDIRYDMISEIDYNHRLLDASVYIATPSKALRFTAYNHARARKLFHFAQTKVMDIRQHYSQPLQPVPQHYMQQAPMQQAFIPPPFPATEWLAYANQLQQEHALQNLPAQVDFSAQQQRQLVHHQPAPQHRVPPVISAYTRLPIISKQRRFLGSRALNAPVPSVYR